MISNRLKTIINFVNEDLPLADCGSDHGHVILELKKRGFKSKIMGIENKKGPFEILSKNVKNSKFDNIDLSFSDGLRELTDDIQTVIIAGMGFETIEEIINFSKAKINNVKYFIIDAHTSKEKVRPYFDKLGYFVDEETVIYENSLFYEIIRFKKGHKDYSEDELHYGPINLKLKSNEFVNMISSIIKYKENILTKIETTNPKYNRLKEEIFKLEEIIK